MTHEEILQEMRLAFEAEKNAGEPTGWRTGSHYDSLIMTIPLEVQALTKGSAWLSLRARARSPDRDVSISLVLTLGGYDRRVWRMDWRPVHPHTNLCGPKHLRGVTSLTGIHDFEVNAKLGLKRMQTEDLPICVPLIEEPHDFDAFVRYVFRRLQISRTEPILGPPWSATLF